MLRKSFISFIAVISLCSFANTFADNEIQDQPNQSTVRFPIGQKTGSFYCTASEDGATVSIDTNRVDAQGFCSGPYVTRPGHIANLPAKTLNQYAFNIEKDIEKDGSVVVTVSSGTVTCNNGSASRPQFAPDAQYCALPPK